MVRYEGEWNVCFRTARLRIGLPFSYRKAQPAQHLVADTVVYNLTDTRDLTATSSRAVVVQCADFPASTTVDTGITAETASPLS